jgi:iron(III) transport system ATP-binding protein
MSDKIAFLSDGKIAQYDTPYNLYHKPSSKEIANFFGITSFMKAKVKDANHVDTVLGQYLVILKILKQMKKYMF